MSISSRPQETISPAVASIINSITDRDLHIRVDILVAKAVGALAATRRINFVGFEERELQDGTLELWNEVAPVFGSVFKELHGLMDAALELFPRTETPVAAPPEDPLSADLDDAFDRMSSSDGVTLGTPLAAGKTEAEHVADLVQSYAWAIKQSTQDEIRKLREPALMVAQWNLLGELEEFRDRTVGALHGMVAAVLGVFDDVEVESLFPAAAQMVEMGVALRVEVAQLSRAVETHVNHLKERPAEDMLVQAMASDSAERTLRVLKLPSMIYLRATDRHELVRFCKAALQLRNATTGPLVQQGTQLLDGYATFLASIQSVELKNRLKDHDQEVLEEALASLRRCAEAAATSPKQALLFLAHAMRRVARLRGLSPQLDATHAELAELSAAGLPPAQLQPLLANLWAALEPLQSA